MIVVVTVGAAVTGREQVIKFYQAALMIRILFCPYILLKTPSAIHIWGLYCFVFAHIKVILTSGKWKDYTGKKNVSANTNTCTETLINP